MTYANELAEQSLSAITGLNGANFAAQLPAVSVLTFGVSYKPIKDLTIAFDAQLSGWSAYDQLNIDFLDAKLLERKTQLLLASNLCSVIAGEVSVVNEQAVLSVCH